MGSVINTLLRSVLNYEVCLRFNIFIISCRFLKKYTIIQWVRICSLFYRSSRSWIRPFKIGTSWLLDGPGDSLTVVCKLLCIVYICFKTGPFLLSEFSKDSVTPECPHYSHIACLYLFLLLRGFLEKHEVKAIVWKLITSSAYRSIHFSWGHQNIDVNFFSRKCLFY